MKQFKQFRASYQEILTRHFNKFAVIHTFILIKFVHRVFFQFVRVQFESTAHIESCDLPVKAVLYHIPIVGGKFQFAQRACVRAVEVIRLIAHFDKERCGKIRVVRIFFGYLQTSLRRFKLLVRLFELRGKSFTLFIGRFGVRNLVLKAFYLRVNVRKNLFGVFFILFAVVLIKINFRLRVKR